MIDPGTLSGLDLWLKADALVHADNTPVTTWTDSSPRLAHATQADATRRPVFRASVLNSKPVVRFDGVAATLAAPVGPVSPSFATVFGVAKLTDGVAADYRHIVSLPAGAGWSPPYGRIRMVQEWTEFSFDSVESGISANAARGMPFDTSWHVWSGSYDGTFVDLQIDGALKQEKDALASGPIPQTVEPYAIGGRSSTAFGEFWSGDLAELLVFNRVLTDPERLGVEQYLGDKYALQPRTPSALVAATVQGFPRDGTALALTTTEPPVQREQGFLRAASGRLVATTTGTPHWSAGFARTADGALLIDVDGIGSVRAGLLRNANGALIVSQTGPFTTRRGLSRTVDGKLAASIT